MNTTHGNDLAPGLTDHDRPTPQVEMVLDVQVGDYLPDYEATVCDVEIRTERLGVEWVDLELTDGRALTLDGHDDLAIGPRWQSPAELAHPDRGTAAIGRP